MMQKPTTSTKKCPQCQKTELKKYSPGFEKKFGRPFPEMCKRCRNKKYFQKFINKQGNGEVTVKPVKQTDNVMSLIQTLQEEIDAIKEKLTLFNQVKLCVLVKRYNFYANRQKIK